MTRKALDSVRRLLSRRRALQGGSALITTAAIGCGDDGASAADATGSSTTGDDEGESGSTSAVADGDSSTGSGSGADSTGDSTGSTTDPTDTDEGTSTGEPQDLLEQIDHIIVVCMENRSFDHYLGARALVEGIAEVDGLTGTETNLDQNGMPVGVFQMDNFQPEDPPHGWDASHAQWNDGANDGFVTEHFAQVGDAVKHEVMGYHVREHLPIYYALADAYTTCDAWFCGLLGPTWPNRYYLHAASSSGTTSNVPASPGPTSIQALCNDHGISNRNYYDGLAAWRWAAYPISGFAGTASIDQFFDKLANGGLEQVVIIDPDFLSNDDHPSHDIQLGQAFIASIYQALANSRYWERSLLIITYDEHGGFFDHVAPPTTVDDNGPEFTQLGFRVPTLVIGPHVRAGAVDHTVF
ncbi:MAG: alkaline phosphatase family protein, partial [Myxococcales bacterium]|nr:alkaline phosphatase family protein [Myxococcales bacterium]